VPCFIYRTAQYNSTIETIFQLPKEKSQSNRSTQTKAKRPTS